VWPDYSAAARIGDEIRTIASAKQPSQRTLDKGSLLAAIKAVVFCLISSTRQISKYRKNSLHSLKRITPSIVPFFFYGGEPTMAKSAKDSRRVRAGTSTRNSIPNAIFSRPTTHHVPPLTLKSIMGFGGLWVSDCVSFKTDFTIRCPMTMILVPTSNSIHVTTRRTALLEIIFSGNRRFR